MPPWTRPTGRSKNWEAPEIPNTMRPFAPESAVAGILQIVPGTFDVVSAEFAMGILEMNNRGRVPGDSQRARLSANLLAKLESTLQ
jgi:hypothetical protein